MAEKIKSCLCKLKEHLCKVFRGELLNKKTLEHNTDSKLPYIPRTWEVFPYEKRVEKAIEYLVEKHYESKKREEELRKKLEGYGTVRKWIYENSIKLKDGCDIFKQIILKPIGMTIAIGSGGLSMLLAITVRPMIVKLVGTHLPSSYGEVLGGITAFFIGFSPMFMSLSLYAYYVNKQIKKRLKEEYGIEV